MRNARAEFVIVGQGVEFEDRYKQAGNRFVEAEIETKGKTRIHYAWQVATATECISLDPNNTRVDPEDAGLR